ncbi:Retrovirus-related Pol polyprotein from transposon RE2; Endonuclease RE2 [Eumeta japonica]|uniref:Retrovirus-related Pol polyprotein from transposon RE2 Endonuclease RE2 n=1 Tax=Eumeta variegata TaxID=151549 RepID=A0A4C1SXK1_EUMVA|nr:Retrovirus-related Pol polyprotein from transposon RE2; Endonuclease RE2 [Eumeta japonica]
MQQRVRTENRHPAMEQRLVNTTESRRAVSMGIQEKFESDSSIRYRARLVAKGFTQQQGVDFKETYAPVLSLRASEITVTVNVPKMYKSTGCEHQMVNLVLVANDDKSIATVKTNNSHPHLDDSLIAPKDLEIIPLVIRDCSYSSHCQKQMRIDLHGFADSSAKASGCAIYGPFRVAQQTPLLREKTQMAPLKSITLPGLELCATLPLARLVEDVS